LIHIYINIFSWNGADINKYNQYYILILEKVFLYNTKILINHLIEYVLIKIMNDLKEKEKEENINHRYKKYKKKSL